MTTKTAFAALLTLSAGTALAASIVNSKHDLSSNSLASVHNKVTTDICTFCHTPHNAVRPAPLWNRLPPSRDLTTYVLYQPSETLSAAARNAQIGSTSASLLCLSCHDGTLEELGSRMSLAPRGFTLPLPMVDTQGTWGTSGVLWDPARTCVANHPVSFDYEGARTEHPERLRTVAEVNAAFGMPAGRSVFFLGTNGASSMECSTCHVIHDPGIPPFLRKSTADNALCLACHVR
jgi:predicted CXXCH cytochrome family protein